MSKRNELMNKCGLPFINSTSHCFADSTHQTCCMLGPEARRYADNSGNPIGEASLKAFKSKHNREANQSELTPWCTCFGSKVCSFYASKFNDGTHIKFLNDPNSENDVLTNIPRKVACEEYARKSLEITAHGTPGVNSANGDSCTSGNIAQITRESIYQLQ